MTFDKIHRKETLADVVCRSIETHIIEGKLPPGEPLPTEPELAKQFDVSRAVIRDACRMLMARGLVDIRHGKGMFVTGSQEKAFGESLLRAMRRDGATVWDVEQFEQTWYPEVFVLAAEHMTPELYEEILSEFERHMKVFAEHTRRALGNDRDMNEEEQDELIASFRPLLKLIMDASGNRLISLLGPALRRLRNLRNWKGINDDPDVVIENERTVLLAMIETLRLENPEDIRDKIRRLMILPPEAVEAMKKTPIGEVVTIYSTGA